MAPVGEHGARLLQAELEDSLGEPRAGLVKQLVHVAGREAKFQADTLR